MIPTILRKICEQVRMARLRVDSLDIKDQVFVFTGFRNSNWNNKIASLGGVVHSTVTNRTTIVVAKNANRLTGKLQKAKSNGATIMSEAELKSLLLKV